MSKRSRLLDLLRVEMIEASSDAHGDVGDSAERALAPYRAMLPAEMSDSLVASLVAGAAGLGPLESLLGDPGVDEVMVNGHDSVWIERSGRIERTGVAFDSVDSLRDAIDRLLVHSGRRVDDMSPLADARLPDGSRVNVALPPLAVDGPVLTIRRFNKERLSIADLVANQTIHADLGRLLRCAVRDGLNVLISGATGSGKTTTLAALAGAIPRHERIVTIEDSAELRLDHPHVVRLEARPAGPTGSGEVVIRDLVRNALRMRPDRIVVGEVRGPEAIEMIDAMTTGHSGSLSTVHAGSPEGAIERLATLAHQAGLGLPSGAVDRRIASAIDLVVQQVRLPSGARLVERVAMVGGSDRTRVEEIFRMDSGRARWRLAGEDSRRSRLRFE